MAIETENWGLIDYPLASERQLARVDQVAAGEATEVLVTCTHPAVVTLGRATREGDLLDWAGPTIETARGGRATYHGPNQLVIYPVLDLRPRGRDIHKFLRQLESAVVGALHEMGLASAEARTTKQGEDSLTGVWVGERKIASIGIAVRKWITYHGVAINLLDDPNAFKGIRPCGFRAEIMTNVERELGRAPDVEAARKICLARLQRGFAF